MKTLKNIIQSLLSFTLLISLLGILCLELEGGIQLKRNTDLYSTKSAHFSMLSALIEENDENSDNGPIPTLNDFCFNSILPFSRKGHELFFIKKERTKVNSSISDLYITHRNFRL